MEGRHEKDSEKMETMVVDKEKIDQSKVRSVVVLDRELEESSFLTETEKDRQYDTDEKDRKEKELVNEENAMFCGYFHQQTVDRQTDGCQGLPTVDGGQTGGNNRSQGGS